MTGVIVTCPPGCFQPEFLDKSLFKVFSPRRGPLGSQPCRMKGKAQAAQRYGYRKRLATPPFAGKAANPKG
ncbi:hypothetical protein GCM10007907_20090 [Chitinimonas prasina]|uniref:Uncharacterized protein n=1 Tax=Chitinimonas prasina TaxID=1434937 RepID=A0ABQ5YH03_9NEIS|nr:hypothetical protein GCM10007907_20090 [Chitinimonas prasina]